MPADPVSSICGRSMASPVFDHQLDPLAVLGAAGLVAQLEILGLPSCAKAHALGIGGFDSRDGRT